ncbi:MAG TPA: hypothetical protein PKD64_13830 [Pirellulaceae bacterium]|nr:hypothetical protein [Pirellulaceae bacterium]HMO93266.1 hypothetical protein [Pirellulaceae bacterium]HMP69131.1 hypothetical protein [Pirellulaceae bacterium]
MNRIYVMTFGLFLILLSLQNFIIKAYILTPDASRFVAERFEAPDVSTGGAYNNASPFYQASYRQPTFFQTSAMGASTNYQQRSIAPPGWLSWPLFFFGTVVFLHGLALPERP